LDQVLERVALRKASKPNAKGQKILNELRAYCDQERGRRLAVARFIDVPSRAITDWFGGRRQPTAEQVLAVQDFLEKQRK
jgi:hypothetical protein